MPDQSAYLEHQLKRWMRPDAHHFVRPDWRRFVRPGYEKEIPLALYERKYSPDQPRDYHGRWTDEGGSDSDTTTELSAAGHHYVPKGVYEKYPLPPETRAFFNDATTGPLLDPSSNWFDNEHRAYNDAIEEEFDRFLKTNNIDPTKMTLDQAGEFLDQVFRSGDSRIQGFNMRMTIREIRRFILRRLRGTE